MDERFADFSMEGERFDAPGLPVETAKELGFYREAVVEVAKKLWLNANPGSLQVPRGFADAFDLRMTEVKKGSARPQLILHKDPGVEDERFDEWHRFYVRGRDEVTKALRTVASEGVLPRSFPRSGVKPLRQIGRTLGDDERIIVGAPRFSGVKATVDRQVHETVKQIDAVLSEELEEVGVEGWIFAFDSTARSFKVRHPAGYVIRCAIQHGREDLSRVAKQYCSIDGMTAPDVRIRGFVPVIDVGRPTLLTDVSSIEHLRSVGEKMAIKKIELLESFVDGWAGDESMAPDKAALEEVRSLVPRIYSMDLKVNIASEDDGSVVLEWRRGVLECTAVLGANRQLFMCVDNVETDELHETETEFDAGVLMEFLRSGVLDGRVA